MNRKQWLKDNQWFIDAIANETQVILSDDGKSWEGPCMVSGFKILNGMAYYIDIGGASWDYAKPEPKTERRYLDPVEMMQWLVDHGYRAYGVGQFKLAGMPPFYPKMWVFCGERVDEKNGGSVYTWHPEWIKEVEVTQ